MQYPSINAGYFWSHERPYYLYGKKGAGLLGEFAVTEFILPAYIDTKKDITIRARGDIVSEKDYDIIGKTLYFYHRSNNITSYNDEVQISCFIKHWYEFGFSSEPAYYVFKILDGITKFILPDNYVSSAPVIITDDRINYLNPSDIVHREYKISYKDNKSYIEFGGKENLFINGDFTETISGFAPIEWTSKINSQVTNSVFLAGINYSYWGDHCVALRCNEDNGYITSPLIKVSSDDALSISWHSSMPVDITGISGNLITSITGGYKVNFYNNYDELMSETYAGTFIAYPGQYTRYYLSFGTSDQVINANNTGLISAPLVALSDTPLALPTNVAKAEITFSGNNYSDIMYTGAFITIDAVQAEYDVNPTYFHPRPSFTNMTVEFETDPSGVFVDNKLNISSVFNENPNGFLYIADMPASIWNGPAEPEVTTLHEYRWPHGRIHILPWARTFGKDKLHQKVIFSDTLVEPRDIIAPYVLPRRAGDSLITPRLILSRQDSDQLEGFNVQVLDDIGNPFGLRNYVMHVYEENGNFPGWLAKKYIGAKEQLGSTLYGQLTSNGMCSAFYLAHDSVYSRYVGPIPVPGAVPSSNSNVSDSISTIETNYRISPYNFGNITIIGDRNKFVSTNGDLISGYYGSTTSRSSQFVDLEYPPVYGSVSVKYGNEYLTETLTDPQSNEFNVHYAAGKIEMPLTLQTGSIYIEYIPKYAYPNPDGSSSIVLHNNKLFGSYSGIIQVDYDTYIKLEVRVADILNREYVNTFEVVSQNPQLSMVANSNISLEF